MKNVFYTLFLVFILSGCSNQAFKSKDAPVVSGLHEKNTEKKDEPSSSSKKGRNKKHKLTQTKLEPIQKSAYIIYTQETRGITFYLGEFNGHHIAITNKHIINSKNCDESFVGLNESFYSCDEYIGSLPSLDVSLFTLTPEDKFELIPLPVSFEYKAGDPLSAVSQKNYEITVDSKVIFPEDSDCFLLSDQPKIIADPDTKHPLPYSSWSLPINCNVGHGDSGAPILNQSNEAIGLVWTGRFPKKRTYSSAELNVLKEKQAPALWDDMNYLVPFDKIRSSLKKNLKDKSIFTTQLKADLASSLYESWDNL